MVKRVGLFDVSTGPLDLPVHARAGGIQYQTSVCKDPHCYAVTCIGDHTSKTLNDGLALITGDPFVIYSDLLCSPVGIKEDEVRQYLFTRLSMGEQLVVESTFSQQLCGQAPGLSNNSGITGIVTPATDPVDAVSQLEAALYATYGPVGVLHVPYRFAPYFNNLWLIEDKYGNEPFYRTDLGTKVNFGNYAGLSTSGGNPTAGSMYIYITGQTTVWRTPDSELFVANIVDTLNRTHNQFTAVMEREYIVSFDCGGFAIECPLTGVVA
jgi:hypothetical protein